MKTPKPGQLYTINGVLYRAKRRTDGCFGCSLNSVLLCPNVVDARNGHKPFDCNNYDIIFVKV